MADKNETEFSPYKLANVARVVLSEDRRIHQKFDEDLVQWIDSAVTSLKIESNPFGDIDVSHVNTTQNLFLQLRECLLSNRWQQVTQLLYAIVSGNLNSTVYNVGSEIAHQGFAGGDQLMKGFVRDLTSVQDINYMQVVLEFMLYLLTQNRYEEIQQTKRSTGPAVQRAYIQILQPETKNLMLAYEGVMYYIQWKAELSQYKELCNREEDCLSSLGEDSYQMAASLKTMADNALLCFSATHHQPGVWDIFLKCELELLKESASINKAIQLLEDYIKDNPTNPWPKQQLILLCGTDHDDKKLQLLKSVCEKDPSHPYALDLYALLKEKGEPCLHILFDVLDFERWQHEYKPWHLLSQHLTALNKSAKVLLDAVGDIWEERASWWADYHFTTYNLTASKPHVRECKLKVAELLLKGKELSDLRKVMPTNGWQRLKDANASDDTNT